MIRLVLMIVANIALPFVLRGLYIYAHRLYAKKQQRKGMKNITPPEYHFPVKKLLMIGLALLAITLGGYRFFGAELDAPFEGNPVKTGEVG